MIKFYAFRKPVWMVSLLLYVAVPLSAQHLVNPVLDQDFPDPTVIRAAGKYYAYATNSVVQGKVIHIQVASSTDLQHWTWQGDALPQKPSWAEKDFWAPHVLYDATLKKYVLFYSAESEDKQTGKCIGVAFSDLPQGPFTDKGSPLICGEGFRDIDPFAFIDPETGKRLLYWGSDSQPIRVQELSENWSDLKPGTAPESLIFPGQEKNYDRLIEGAWVDYHQGKYYLYYSGDNCCGNGAHYAVMVARSDHAMGPFKTMGAAKKTTNSVILQQNKQWTAPGHNSIFRDDQGHAYIAYHAIRRNQAERHGRVFCISKIAYKNGWPAVDDQSETDHEITWGDTVIINDDPIRKVGSGTAVKYGSQYGRMLQLQNGKWLAAYTVLRNAGYRKDPRGGQAIEIAQSMDQGRHWTPISTVSQEGRDVDNAALIELPDHTILLGCRSVRWQQSYRLPVYKSTDQGRSWKPLSIIDANEGSPGQLGHPDKGVYEPHFYFLADGRLSVMYANEKHVSDSISYSQIISQKISPDLGKSWGKEIWVAYEPGHPASRPGMPVWTRMKNNRYIVTFEVCGPEGCNIYYKTSDDGISWPVGLGTQIPDQTGAPYVLSMKNGLLVLTSNRGNISISEDFSKHWYTAAKPWHPEKSYAEDWTQTIWSSLYQTGPDEIGIITTVQRAGGGHNIRLRFGHLSAR